MMSNREVQLETEEHPRERGGKSFAKRQSELSCVEQGETRVPWLGDMLAACKYVTHVNRGGHQLMRGDKQKYIVTRETGCNPNGRAKRLNKHRRTF